MVFVLFVNLVIFVLTALLVLLKHRVSVYSFLWFYYAVFATMGFFVVVSGVYDERFFNINYNNNLTLFPYLCNFFCIFLLLRPFKYVGIDNSFYDIDKINVNNINKLVNVLCVFFTFYLLIKLGTLGEYSKYSLLERREMSIAGESVIDRDRNFVLWLVLYVYELLHTAIFPFLLVLVIVYYDREIINKKKMGYVILLYFLPPFLSFLLTSNRSGLFWLVMNTTFYFFLFFHIMSKELKKTLSRVALSIMIPIAILLALITQVRYENSNTSAETGLLSYFGESFPNLGTVIYDQVASHTYGMRLFPDYVQLITGYSIKADGGLAGYHEFWEKYTGVEIPFFKTLFGDLYVEFGTIGAILFVFLLSACVTIYIKRSKHIYTLFAIMSYYYAFSLNSVLDFGLVYGKMYVPRIIVIMLCFGFFWRKYIFINQGVQIDTKEETLS